MTGSVDNWDVLDDLISRDGGERKEQEKLYEVRPRPATSTAGRKSVAAADDWLGLRPKSNNAEPTTSAYEPSSSGGGSNPSRRLNLRRQSTQQQRPSRSAGLLFISDDDDGDDNGGGDNDVVRNTTAAGDGKKNTVGGDVSAAESALSKRRETSPSITVTAAKTAATENMPSWLSGLIHQKDENVAPPPRSPSPPPILSIKAEVEKPEKPENKITEQNSSTTILSLLRGKDSLQTTILEFVQELAKKKHDIQQATITMIQDQQNSDLLIKALLTDSNSSVMNPDGQELERIRSENHKFQLTIDHLSKKHELELDALKNKYELHQNVLHEKLSRLDERIKELEAERKADAIERKENETRLKETYEDRLRVIHESHLVDLKQSAEVQKIKMNHLEEVECSLRNLKPKRLTSDEMTAREISISAREEKLKDLQEEVDKQMTSLEGERSALQMRIEEFQSRNQRERNELELAGKDLKRSMKAFEDKRKTWEREKSSEVEYIEGRKQELEAVRSSVVEEQRKLAEERFELASERYKLESMLKLDTGINTTEKDLIQAKVEAEENFNELRKKEKELEKRLEHVKESEKRMTEDRHKLQELDDKIKLKSIRAEKTLKTALSTQEEGLKALESAKSIQNKFDKKGKDIHNRLLDIIRREENVMKEETRLVKERDAFNKQRKKLNLVLPQLSEDEMYFLNPKLNKYEAEKEMFSKKSQLYV